MTAWPYIHTATAAITPEGQVSVAGPEPAAVSTAGFELAGIGNMGSPQTLMTCAVAWSFATAFRTEAEAAGIPWDTLELGVDGTVDRNRGGTRFARFDLALDVQASPARTAALRRAADRALRQSLATNSLAAPTHVTVRVHAAPGPTADSDRGHTTPPATTAANG